MSTLRWYQTTPDRVWAIVTTILAAMGYVALALAQLPMHARRADLVASALMLVLPDLVRRLRRLEDRR